MSKFYYIKRDGFGTYGPYSEKGSLLQHRYTDFEGNRIVEGIKRNTRAEVKHYMDFNKPSWRLIVNPQNPRGVGKTRQGMAYFGPGATTIEGRNRNYLTRAIVRADSDVITRRDARGNKITLAVPVAQQFIGDLGSAGPRKQATKDTVLRNAAYIILDKAKIPLTATNARHVYSAEVADEIKRLHFQKNPIVNKYISHMEANSNPGRRPRGTGAAAMRRMRAVAGLPPRPRGRPRREAV